MSRLLVLAAAAAAAPWQKLGPHNAAAAAAAPWQKLGPHNIGDDVRGQGYAGTLADAVSPIANKNIIYTGGHNNGASSGVLKSTDRGKTWIPFCNGLWDTTIGSLIIVDDAGDHVLAGTPTGIYETTDGASSWRLMPGSTGIGWARSMKNGTINGEPRILAGVDNGIASWHPTKGGSWSLAALPAFIAAQVHLTRFITVADVLPSSVVGVCMQFAFIITMTSPTTAAWRNTSLQCLEVGINPNDPDHFIYSNMSSAGKQTWESRDGGKTHHNLHSHYPWHVAIDRRGWLYHAAEAGAFFSANGGTNWSAYQYTTTQRGTNATGHRIPQDYQRIVTDFAGGVALVSDQGIFIAPDDDSVELIGACGNMSNNIAISPAVSYGDGKERWIVTTAWDWGPLASWDSGRHWPGWNCADCEGPGYTHGGIGEGGFTAAFGRSNHMLMIHHSNVLHSSRGGKNMTLVHAPASMPWPVYTRRPGSRSEPDGRLWIKMGVPPPNRTEAVGWARTAWDDSGDGSDGGGGGGGGGDDDRRGEAAAQRNGSSDALGGGTQWLLKNSHFGAGEFNNTQEGWLWVAAFPPHLAECGLTTSPVDGGAALYAFTPSCIATSEDEGATWSACWGGLDGQPIASLVIKDATTMFVRRTKLVPLRTRDGGKTWTPLDALAPVAAVGFSFDLSWSGRTIVVHGLDTTAVAEGRKAVFVWRSTDDGDTFVDETGDVVTNHPAGGYWYEGTFYLTTSGQGIMAKVFEDAA